MTRVVDGDSVDFFRDINIIPVRGRDRKTCHVVVVDRKCIVNTSLPER